jgi:hypothetical protein
LNRLKFFRRRSLDELQIGSNIRHIMRKAIAAIVLAAVASVTGAALMAVRHSNALKTASTEAQMRPEPTRFSSRASGESDQPLVR